MERFVQEGGVKIEEVLKGAPKKEDIDALVRSRVLAIRREMEDLYNQPYAVSPEELTQIRSEAAQEVEQTKFATYQVPGGENYRELLITAPVVKEENWSIQYTDGSSATKYGEYPTREAAQAALVESGETDIAEPVRNDFVKPEQQYTSSHWSEPNVLVHIRFNERTDVDGKRVLFVEEVQSDLQQEYRKKTKDLQQEIDTNFEGLVARLKAQGDLVVECA
jgi:hypothetical protein